LKLAAAGKGQRRLIEKVGRREGLDLGTKANASRHIEPEVRRHIRRWVSRAALGVVGYGLVLFLVAGQLRWVWGWLFLVVLTAVMAAHPLLLIPSNPELLAERDKGTWADGVKPWDKRLTTLAGGLMLFTWVLAALDKRLGWSGPISIGYHFAGVLLNIAGYSLFLWAMVANPFFTEGVRIQEERNHQVATGGPYHYLRHPGYAGAVLAHLATPLFLGSWWAMFAAVPLVLVYIVRTRLEDQMLQVELPGYQNYVDQVPHRLLPGVW
jgi:protein-S-isoprenylcysteine O-methyltransferase Ste14